MDRKTSKLLKTFAESDPTLTHRGLKKWYQKLSQEEKCRLKKELKFQIQEINER